MAVYKEVISLQSHGGTPTYINVTEEVKKAIADSGIQNGIVAVISPHTTCSVFFEEYVHDVTEDGDEFLQADLNDILDRIVPQQTSADIYRYPGQAHYDAVKEWPNYRDYLPTDDPSDLWNGDAHLRSTLLGSSCILDVDNGKLGVGTTGYVYFVDFDRCQSRKRKCKIVVISE